MSNWRETAFNKSICEGVILNEGKGDILVKGKVKVNEPDAMIMYWAAAPADRMYTCSGSALPFANPHMAHEATPNIGKVPIKNGEFQFRIEYPNAYYTGLGSLYIEPHVNIKLCGTKKDYPFSSLRIDGGMPFRTLTYPAPPSKKPRTSPFFYYNPDLPVRTQEQVLRDSAYPCEHKMPDNFWGLKPPN